jgi:hypothetical protein
MARPIIFVVHRLTVQQVIKTLRQTRTNRFSYSELIYREVEKDGWFGFFTRGLKTKYRSSSCALSRTLQLHFVKSAPQILKLCCLQVADECGVGHRLHGCVAVLTRLDESHVEKLMLLYYVHQMNGFITLYQSSCVLKARQVAAPVQQHAG